MKINNSSNDNNINDGMVVIITDRESKGILS